MQDSSNFKMNPELITSEELSEALSGVLPSRVTELRRSPYAYQSSFALEEIEASLANGTGLHLMFKDLGRERVLEDARKLKLSLLYDPQREIRTYADILSWLNLGTPAFYGAVVDERIGRYWLFLEKVTGIELYQIGEFSIWQAAAEWLASMHERCVPVAQRFRETVPLLSYTEDYCRLWMRRAEKVFDSAAASGGGSLSGLARQYEKAVERIASLPVTFIHGEFYPSNILIDSRNAGLRICPVDWEMAALGPAALDLAALTSGRWTVEEKTSLVRAYISGRPELQQRPDAEEFRRDLEYCRLYVAIHWLGWFGSQEPYSPHRQDWLGEALRLADSIA